MLIIHSDKSVNDLLDRYVQDYLMFQGREIPVNASRIARLRRAFGEALLLTPTTIDRFFLSLSHLQPSSRNRYRSLLSHIIHWSRQRGLLEGELPDGLLKMERENNERTRRLSAEEEVTLAGHLDTDMRLLLYAALDTGLRRGALLKLRRRDLQAGVLVVPASIQKQRVSQRIPLTARLQSLLTVEDTLPDDLLFPVDHFREKWDRARELAGAQDLHWHDLRGEFASRLSERDVRVEIVSRLLGHASLKTTQRYLRPRMSDFADAIGKLD
jgi:integrase